jgi:hypothetical protein
VTGHLDLVASARPDFVGLAPVARALSRQGRLVFRVVHTGRLDDGRPWDGKAGEPIARRLKAWLGA